MNEIKVDLKIINFINVSLKPDLAKERGSITGLMKVQNLKYHMKHSL